MRGFALILWLAGCAKPQAPIAPPAPAPPAPAAPSVGPAPAPVAPPVLDRLQTEPGADAVLRFGWAAGDVAAVRHEVVAMQLNGDMMSSKTSTTASWTEYFDAAEGSFRYGARDGESETRIEPPPVARETMEAVMDALTLAFVDSVVDEGGRWTGVAGADGLRAEVAGRLAPLMDGLPPSLQDALVSSMQQGLTDEVVRGDAERRWAALVGDWAQRTLVSGEQTEELVDGRTVRTQMRGWAPCAPTETEARCVLIERETRAGVGEIEASRQRLMAGLNGSWPSGQPLPEIASSEILTRESLLTDPTTLRPAVLHKRKVDSHTLSVEGQLIPWGRDIRSTTYWTWSTEEGR